MPMVAQQKPYTLFIVDDTQPENPREMNDNFGKMFCWHKRYSLGDEHDYKDPEDFLINLCYETVPIREIVEHIIGNRFDYLRFEPDEEDEATYHLQYYDDYFKKWYTEATYESPPADVEDEIADMALSCMKMAELLETAQKYNVMLPLYLYDHSGITMNTRGFSCPWDSGMVGWIYADYDMIKKEYGEVTPETLEKARDLLESEVKEYDYYLTGQCYGFTAVQTPSKKDFNDDLIAVRREQTFNQEAGQEDEDELEQ